MAKYIARPLPSGDLERLVDAIEREFKEIEWALLEFEQSHLVLKEWHAEPDKLFDGMVVLADGTDWNPDATNGKGLYRYNGSTWTFVG
jgi:hypothetical protein